MESSTKRIVLVGVGLVALTYAGVRGSESLVAFAKDKREVHDPVARLPALRERATELGLLAAPVPAAPTPAGDARPALDKIRRLLAGDRRLASVANGLADSTTLDRQPNAGKLRGLVEEVLSCHSYLPTGELDYRKILRATDRTAERALFRVVMIDVHHTVQTGDLDTAINQLRRLATFLRFLSDHTDDNAVVTWYAGVRSFATAMTAVLASPRLTERQLTSALSCVQHAEACPGLDKICVRMMNELVATTREADKLTHEELGSLNMNGLNTHPPHTDAKSKLAMESGLLGYFTKGIEVAKNRTATPLQRGLEIDRMILPLQREDRTDHYMLRTITPVTFQLGQTITRANEMVACLEALAVAVQYRQRAHTYPDTIPARSLSVEVDGHVYNLTYENHGGRPAVHSYPKTPTDYDTARHVSVDPSAGVYVNL
ncbi:MAG: hypothetical protein KF857_06760 [Fimbriimonadaceae bacterium]|nr:hypothetical protein [Fimbriimonadaceae bacterium]